MRHKSKNQKVLRDLLEADEKEILRDAQELKQALCKLRFEGKQHLKKNLSKANSALFTLKKRLFIHMKDEENNLFPFLVHKLPRFESARHLFLSEHAEFREKIKHLGKILKRLKSNRIKKAAGEAIQRAYSEGMYLTCLILSHVKVEGRQLYRAIRKELTVDEKKQLKNLLILNS